MFRLLIVGALAVASIPTLVGASSVSAAGKDVDPSQKVRCKTEDVTGSLAGRRRTCMTVAQWQEQADRASRDATRLIDHGTVCTGPSCSGGQ